MNLYRRITTILASRWMFWGIICLFILEALWIAISFGYPLVYDEAFHFPVIKIFSQHWSPFIFNQPHSADKYDSLLYEAGIFYHYIMAFPYRVIEHVTSNFGIQVVSLRVINILMAAGGLYLFDRLFRKVGIKQIFSNITLLTFILIPLVPFVAATINYDNMLFLFTPAYMLACVAFLKEKKADWKTLVNIISLGCFVSLVKDAFLPLFAASMVYLLVVAFRKYGKQYWSLLVTSFKQTSKSKIAVYLLVFAVMSGIFSIRYIYPTVVYGSPLPDCTETMPKERCQSYSSKLTESFIKTKDKRKAEDIPAYTENWFEQSFGALGRVVAVGPGWNDYQPALPIVNTLLFTLVFGGLSIMLYAWRSIEKPISWYFLMTMVVMLVVTTYVFNYGLYLKLHYPFAIQSRYLLNMTPILMVMIVISLNRLLQRYAVVKLSLLLVVLLLFTQGGGVTSYIVRSKDFWFWNNNEVVRVNHDARQVLQPLIKE